MKIRFPVLNFIRVHSPAYAAEIVKACSVLHNLCIQIEGNIANDNLNIDFLDGNLFIPENMPHQVFNRRNEIIATFPNM